MSIAARPWQGLKKEGTQVLRKGTLAFFLFARILLPIQLIMQLLQRSGLMHRLALEVQPMMDLFLLPGELVFPWVAGISGGVYGATSLALNLGQSTSYTVAQMTTLGLLVLFTHNLINEVLVAKLTGLPVWLSLLQRVFLSLLYTAALAWGAKWIGWGQQAVVFPPYFSAQQQGWGEWIVSQVLQFAVIWAVIVGLISLLRILELIRMMRVLMLLLRVILQPLRLGNAAGELMLAGLTLGLSYGAALLLAAKKEGLVPRREMLTVVSFLNICHSLIEDTLLVAAFGSAIFAVVVLRLLLAMGSSLVFVYYLAPRFAEAEPIQRRSSLLATLLRCKRAGPPQTSLPPQKTAPSAGPSSPAAPPEQNTSKPS